MDFMRNYNQYSYVANGFGFVNASIYKFGQYIISLSVNQYDFI